MYAIYGNIYHQYTPHVSINLPYMDPMENQRVRWIYRLNAISKVASSERVPNGCPTGAPDCWLQGRHGRLELRRDERQPREAQGISQRMKGLD